MTILDYFVCFIINNFRVCGVLFFFSFIVFVSLLPASITGDKRQTLIAGFPEIHAYIFLRTFFFVPITIRNE